MSSTILARLLSRLRPHRSDPLALLRVAPSPETVETERALERLEASLDILQQGVVTMNAFTNVAPGTEGAIVVGLERQGFMRSRGAPGASPAFDLWRYEVTESGRHFLRARRPEV